MGRNDLRVAFRVDASLRIGTGHLMRCLSLADTLGGRGATCHFITGSSGPLLELLRSKGHAVHDLPSRPVMVTSESAAISADQKLRPYAAWLDRHWLEDAQATLEILDRISPDWLVVDHYALDAPWEDAVRGGARRLMVIDDLADRSHRCDLLLDCNLHADAPGRYVSWLNPSAQLLLGPQYVLLRPEFAEERRHMTSWKARRGLFVGYGGADSQNLTLDSVRAAQRLLISGVPCDVVVGAAYPHLRALEQGLARPGYANVHLHVATTRIAALMGQSRLALCGGGGSTWERMCMGLPSLVIASATNQVEALQFLDSQGLIRLLDFASDVAPDVLGRELCRFWERTDDLSEMSQRGVALVDGDGTSRVADRMLAMAPNLMRSGSVGDAPADSGRCAGTDTVSLAPLTQAHVPLLAIWKNDAGIVHQIAAHPGKFSHADVALWLTRNCSDPGQVMLGIFDDNREQPIGVARLMFIDWTSRVAELGVFIGDGARRGRKRGRKAVMQLLHQAFVELGLERVHLRVMSDNGAAIGCYRACHFVLEGTLRSHFLSEGVRYDMHVMGILRREYLDAIQNG